MGQCHFAALVLPLKLQLQVLLPERIMGIGCMCFGHVSLDYEARNVIQVLLPLQPQLTDILQ